MGLSGPEYVTPLQESIPEPVSVPVAVTVTGWLYQPFASGGRENAVVTPGGVESYWSEDELLAEFPALSVQVPCTVAAAASGPL